MRRRAENRFRPQQAQPYGQMAVQWLTWESVRTERSIRHQVNGREKRIGKLPVDGWCAKTHTAYQFHGCYFHGCPKCYDENEMNPVNGKTMAEHLANTKTHTAYLRRFVDVVEMWECEWKGKRIESDTKRFIDAEFPRRSTRIMTQHQILAAVVDGTLFGMVECDICVPRELQYHVAEMQNTTVTRNDIGPFMRDYAEEHDIMSAPRRMLVGSYRGDKILLSTPLLQWYLMHGLIVDHVYQVVEYEPKPCFRHFGDSVSTARRAGDANPDKAMIADTMKLLGISGYGKTVTNIDRHRDVKYCTEVGTSALINNKRLRQRVRNRIEQASREVHPSTPHRFLRLPVRQVPHATVLLRLCRQVRRTTAVPVLRNGHRFGIHCASRRDHRRSHHFRTPRALLPPQIRMVAGRMLRRARGRVRPGPTGWTRVDGH